MMMGYVKCVRVCTRIIHLMMKNMMAMKVSFREKADKGLDAEALRVVGLIPKWIPAKKNGTPIKQKLTMNIPFRMM